ncbi:hypothetical protein [Actinacidiphila oryziradicis]|uniref:Uncharacterized protein n=1 Tax=Actinacidiphila oryziradicis TaxID=2571141 RepID=A0A4U0RVP3_9ACTN|nr:hypothetical protein [Actinacidiphila oryziradicis]TJZ92424.1 hypothetical protein FCI23_55135 [Actinacidiphila oryziradicis]
MPVGLRETVAGAIRRLPGVTRMWSELKGAAVAENELPIPGYGELTAIEVTDRLPRLSQADLATIDGYERAHAGRSTVLNKIADLRGDEPWPGYDSMKADRRPGAGRAGGLKRMYSPVTGAPGPMRSAGLASPGLRWPPAAGGCTRGPVHESVCSGCPPWGVNGRPRCPGPRAFDRDSAGPLRVVVRDRRPVRPCICGAVQMGDYHGRSR